MFISNQPFVAAIKIHRPKFTLTLIGHVFRDVKSREAMENLHKLTLPVESAGELLQMSAIENLPGRTLEGSNEYELASPTLTLSFFAHMTEYPEQLEEAFRDDPRPFICMAPLQLSMNNRYLVMGVDVTGRNPVPQIRLISTKSLVEACGGFYRPVGVLIPKKEEK